MLRATLFGTFRLNVPGGGELEITGKRARAVLAILCLTPGVAVERGRLCELLWQGRFQAQARASLRQTLLGLKKQLAPVRPDFLEITRDSVAVNPAALESDLGELESTLAEGPRARASEILMEIGSKGLLGRLSFGKAFDQWLTARRAQVEQRLKYAVEQALADLQRRGDDCNNDVIAIVITIVRTSANTPACSMPGGFVFRQQRPTMPMRGRASRCCRSRRRALMTRWVRSPRDCSTNW